MYGSENLGDHRRRAADEKSARAKREYHDLIKQAAESGGLYMLDSDDRDRVVELAGVLNLGDGHNLVDDVRRMQEAIAAAAEVPAAEAALAELPTLKEIQANIDALDDEIRAAVEPLHARKRHLLGRYEEREAAEIRLKEAKHRHALPFSSAPHLKGEHS